MKKRPEHEVVDIERWIRQFPASRYENQLEFRRFDTTAPDDPLDLRKVHGTEVTSPSQFARIEQVRRQIARDHDLGPAVPTDLILWGVGEPAKPYLTKVGGVPYRPAGAAWPRRDDGRPMTFFAQFCFADSGDLLPIKLPGDVMLVFFADEDAYLRSEDGSAIQIEWHDLDIAVPATARECPEPAFPVPNLYGALCRTAEYPECDDAFERAGHYSPRYFEVTQASRIGGESLLIQHDPRRYGEILLCTLNSIVPEWEEEFPFVNRESPLRGQDEECLDFYFGDMGCIYFLIDPEGNARWHMDCY